MDVDAKGESDSSVDVVSSDRLLPLVLVDLDFSPVLVFDTAEIIRPPIIHANNVSSLFSRNIPKAKNGLHGGCKPQLLEVSQEGVMTLTPRSLS